MHWVSHGTCHHGVEGRPIAQQVPACGDSRLTPLAGDKPIHVQAWVGAGKGRLAGCSSTSSSVAASNASTSARNSLGPAGYSKQASHEQPSESATPRSWVHCRMWSNVGGPCCRHIGQVPGTGDGHDWKHRTCHHLWNPEKRLTTCNLGTELNRRSGVYIAIRYELGERQAYTATKCGTKIMYHTSFFRNSKASPLHMCGVFRKRSLHRCRSGC